MRFFFITCVGLVLLNNSMVHAEASENASSNLVVTEMRLLDKAFKNLLDSLLLNTPERIEESFHAVHKAKHHTERALKEGKILLPKNPEKIQRFQEMDEEFHHTLEDLLRAARGKNMESVRLFTHKVLDGCVQCHSMFRE